MIYLSDNQAIMKPFTKIKLQEAYDYCCDEGKSTEFMLQYMQDYAGVNLDCVLNFIKDKLRK
jgi:hypothetical protein